MATSKYIIYALQDPITFEIRYIGKSCSGFHRINRHFRVSEFKYDKNKHKINWIVSLKKKNLLPNVIVIQEFFDKITLAKAEAYWIGYFSSRDCPLLNISLGGEQISLSEETKKKLSLSIKNRFQDPDVKERHRKGTIKGLNTPESKAKRSEITKSFWKNPEYAENISQQRKLFWVNVDKVEHGKLISEGRKQKIIDQYGVIYESQMFLATLLNVSRSKISTAIKENKPVKGYLLRKI